MTSLLTLRNYSGTQQRSWGFKLHQENELNWKLILSGRKNLSGKWFYPIELTIGQRTGTT